MNKIHFQSIDALRFFAFLKVYLLHIPIQGSFPIFSFLKSGGGIGVSFFFVLSGFLITYLLVSEKLASNSINIKRFVVRRGLRIWPLFYFMILLAFLLPYDFKQYIGFHMVGGGYDFDWRYSFTFLENYKMLITDQSAKTTPLSVFWSLCIEEHFYIVWMLVMSFIPSKYILKFLISCFLVAWVSRFVEPFLFSNQRIETNDLFTNIDFFASGGLLGYFVAKDFKKVSDFIQRFSDVFKGSIIVLIVLVVIFQKQVLPYEPSTLFFIFRSSIIGLMFTLLIAIFLPAESNIRISSKVLNYLGVRSFGLYVYHIILIHVGFQYCLRHNIVLDNWFALSGFIVYSFCGSVIISMLSYKYFEMPFLRLRNSKWLNKYL